jgi:hypothetical protein
MKKEAEAKRKVADEKLQKAQLDVVNQTLREAELKEQEARKKETEAQKKAGENAKRQSELNK